MSLLPEPIPGGLQSAEAARRLQEFGPNEVAPKHARSPWADFLILFTNPLAVVLLIAAGVSRLAGEVFDSTLIAVLVVLGNGIDFLQTYRSRKAIEHLRSRVAPTATVLRDSQWLELHRNEIVPGDIIRLSAGDLIPADARLVQSRDLYVQQSMLTGESSPAEKAVSSDPPSESANATHMVFVGTSVISGTAIAEVAATGKRTAFGEIAAKLAERPPETAFDAGLRQFSYLITRVVFGLVLFVVIVSLALHRPPLLSLLFAVSLAVGMTPEFLPMITAVTLARGAIRMAGKHVVVKRLPSIQNLGSIDILCSDKTGTLTTGELQLQASLSADGKPSDAPLRFARINSALQAGIKSPLDSAILAAPYEQTDAPTKLDEIPFDFQRRRLSVVAALGSKRLLICKGSPESVFPLLSASYSQAGDLPITSEARHVLIELYRRESAKGFRMLAVAIREAPDSPSYSVADESNLTLVGLLSFSDPILPDASLVVQRLKRDGVAVKILSGDSDLVTTHICAQAGMPVTGVLLGQDIDPLSEPALQHLAEKVDVFARLSPAQKVRVLSALRRRGHVVGFIGDGINDAPAMHAADVGIAAPHAVDVAQDAADVVLLQPGLNVLHDGILEGRRAFGNVMKYLLMGTSSNFGNVLSMAVAAAVLPFLPMLPVQVLLNNFLYDLSQLSIPTDNVDPEYMRKPQHWDLKTVLHFMIFIGPISSIFDFLTFWILLRLFHAGEAEFHSGWFIESLATQTLVLLIIRTTKSPFRSRPSLGLLSTVCFAVLVGLWLPFSRFATTLGLSALPLNYAWFLLPAIATYLVLVEIAKRFLLRSHSTGHISPSAATIASTSPVHRQM